MACSVNTICGTFGDHWGNAASVMGKGGESFARLILADSLGFVVAAESDIGSSGILQPRRKPR